MSLCSTGPLWENPGNSLISACVNARIVYGGMESPLGTSRHPWRPVTMQRIQSDTLFHTENESLQLRVCVGQGLRMAAYALCIINGHVESDHNGCSAPHNASVSKGGVRGRVWLCAWPSRTETNKETFQSAGGFMYRARKQRRAKTAGQSVSLS